MSWREGGGGYIHLFEKRWKSSIHLRRFEIQTPQIVNVLDPAQKMVNGFQPCWTLPDSIMTHFELAFYLDPGLKTRPKT